MEIGSAERLAGPMAGAAAHAGRGRERAEPLVWRGGPFIVSPRRRHRTEQPAATARTAFAKSRVWPSALFACLLDL